MAKTKKQKTILRGLPASPGKVQGMVKIVKKANDFKKLKGGEIVIASFMDPDFIFYFKKGPLLSGIITDQGGITSHAAILARELRIPYVAGVRNATKTLKNNALVYLDAEKGIVYEI